MDFGYNIHRPCVLYKASEDDRMPSGSIWTEQWNAEEQDIPSYTVPNPCQSTGTWYLNPTTATVAFMRAVVDRIAYHAVWQWDQTAWNEIIIQLLWGTGDHEPLKYRVLSLAEFSNIRTLFFWLFSFLNK